MADLEFFFDPVCPWAWITSRWAVEVRDHLDLEILWSPISLAILNENLDYSTKPPGYRAGHITGRNLLRVIDAARRNEGESRVFELYTLFGTDIHTGDRAHVMRGWREGNVTYLESLGLGHYADAAIDGSIDDRLRRSTERALEGTGHDVGTPIVTFDPPDGPSFFGPVMSRIPRGQAAVELWHAVKTVAGFPGMAELKRSDRLPPVFD